MMQASAIAGLAFKDDKIENVILFRLDPEAGCLICFTLCSQTLITASRRKRLHALGSDMVMESKLYQKNFEVAQLAC